MTFAGGTSTADITGQSITLGDGSTDEKLRVYYSDNSYIDLHGYGIYLNRSFSYIRPNSNNTISLLIGSSTQNFSNIRNYAVTHNWFDASSELMRLTSTGRLGINTSTPQTFLDVNLGGNTNQYASFGGTISSGEYTGIHFGYLETGNSLYRKSMIVFERDDSAFGDARGKIHILNGPTGSSSSATIADAKLTINQDGNVGINQQNPTEKLHVVGDALIYVFYLLHHQKLNHLFQKQSLIFYTNCFQFLNNQNVFQYILLKI